MRKLFLVTLLSLLVIPKMLAQDEGQFVLGTKHSFHSQILDEERAYWISLPDSYDDTGASYKQYPVLVVLDGNVHFKAVAALVNYMSADAYRSWKIPEMIVVGIQNVDRRRDYTPDKVITVRPNNTGGGDRFLHFLEEELLPELDQKFRTTPYRILFGHSLGGLLATHAYLKEKTVFKAFMAIDPSFGTWDPETMDGKLASMTPDSFNRFLYIATANWGKRNLRNRDRHIRFYEALHAACPGDLPAKQEYFEKESHASVPTIAFYNGITAIFEGYGISYRNVTSMEQLIGHFSRLSKRLSWEVHPPEHLVNQLGYSLLRSKAANAQQEAIAYFTLNVTNYPESPNAFDSLGEAYEVLGDTQKAIENYKKSLELNPDDRQIKTKLEALSTGK